MATESPTHDLAQTVQEISERASLLVREEIELAKAEVTEKITKLLRGIVIGLAAGIFIVTGMLFFMHGMAWLAWYALPVSDGSFFWGFFVVAGLLFVLGGVVRLPRREVLQGGHAAGARRWRSTRPARSARRSRCVARSAPSMPTRTPEQIRASIEANRRELGTSMERLQSEIAVLTDWRGQLVKHQKQAVIGAAVAGFVIGGGIAAFGGLFRRRR